jgi:hypothetical protein
MCRKPRQAGLRQISDVDILSTANNRYRLVPHHYTKGAIAVMGAELASSGEHAMPSGSVLPAAGTPAALHNRHEQRVAAGPLSRAQALGRPHLMRSDL